METPNIMLIGCGPHAKRVYVPKLKEIESEFGIKLKAIVELKEKQEDILTFASKYFENINYFFVDKFEKNFKQSLPEKVENRLNSIIAKENINSVIIATDPLNHMQYALWALKHNLHILMDKPISTYDNISNNVEQAEQLKKDYELLVESYSGDKAFIVNAQRRFLPQFQIVQDLVNEISSKYGMPITSMQSTHSDGQWRLPYEVLKFKYHPLLGWGKVSHSGYHFIDMASKIVKDSFKEANKNFDEISLEDHYKLYEEKGLNKKEIDHLFYEIRSCNPFPCNMYNTSHDDYVSPDILIEVENSDITITPINQPALMVNDILYEKVKNDENMKAYFNEAHFLMENMTKRNQTVLIVANALVNIQSGYFLYDDELYPCTLSQLASETGFHESTISRTLNNKYYSFNGEVYPLKKLLVSQTASGDSSDSIKKAIVELVDNEDKEHPLSDNQILKKLEELELHCSRRVIVKYRQQLNIPSSTKRKMLKKVG